MALSAAIVWEVRTDGSDNSGGGFKAGASGTDRSQQAAAHATLTTLSVVHTTTTQIAVSLTDYTVTSADIGNVFQITGGTATAGFYEITAVDTGLNLWTVDRSAGTAGQTTVGAMGGALATPGKAGGAHVASNTIWIKAGTYTLSSTTSNASGGPLSSTLTGAVVEGYNSTRGDLGTAPLIQVPGSGVTTITIVTVTGAQGLARNISVDGASKTSIRGFLLSNSGPSVGAYLFASGCTNSGIDGGQLFRCHATGTTGGSGFNSVASAIGCVSSGGTVNGFTLSSPATVVFCISDSNTGGANGFRLASGAALCLNCVAYGNGAAGFRMDSNGAFVVNCIAEGNGGHGYSSSASRANARAYTSAGYNNTSGNVDTATLPGVSVTALTGSPFTNAAGDDFSLNNTAGAGASCRAAGFPGTYTSGSTTGYLDIGAAQHQDAGGSTVIVVEDD